MKKIISLLLLITILSPANSFSQKKPAEERVEIVFTHDLKYTDLIAIKQNLLEKGIFIEYRRLEFDKKKKLKKIGFFADCKDGYFGTASTSKLTSEKKFGFYRDYGENSTTHFYAGFF
jgi:hypothetical protein